jgi:hypothetical protein
LESYVSRAPSLRRKLAVLVGTAGLSVGLLGLTGNATAAPGHTGVPASVPTDKTPDIKDGNVGAIWDAGTKVIAGGTFTSVENHNSDTAIARSYLVAFDKATGAVDPSFAPVLDGEVTAVLEGPTAGTVFIAGAFSSVNGTTRKKVAVLNVSNGTPTTWKGPAINSRVNDAVKVGANYLIGGAFTVIGGQSRLGLASLTATNGALNSYLTIGVDGHHNWTGPGSGAKSPIGPDKLAASPDGRKLVAIGNFKTAGGVTHDQVVKIDLGTTSATIANWNTDRFAPRCAANAFDSWVRDVAFSPDSSFFVIVTTGAPFPGTLCDTASFWYSDATGSAVVPRWINVTGGDTMLSVTITEKAVYVGGHFRWLNNSAGRDAAAAGAVARPSIAALDPMSGLPLAWNPGRRPRAYGITELYATPEGLWIGHDADWMGNYAYRRERIAFIPMAGGYTPHSTALSTLPGKVYQAGSVPGAGTNDAFTRTFDGTTAGTRTAVSNPDGTAWGNVRGAFWAGGTLFYGLNGALYRRTFNGTTFGTASLVDPYHDPNWDNVPTDSGPEGQTYRGETVNFYAEIANVTGMFYTNGRVYYTLAGQNPLYWRWFTPDSGIVGADRYTVASTGFAASGGVFVSGNQLYLVNNSTGALSRATFANNAITSSFSVVNTQDWRSRATFVAP